MAKPTTDNIELDTVVAGLTQVLHYARHNINRRQLQSRLRATPEPNEPIALGLYRLLNTLAENLPISIASQRSVADDNNDTPIVSEL